jgi:hypothetical protein
MNLLEKINPIWFYRIVRLLFAVLFFCAGWYYQDGWPAYIFSAIFAITALLKPVACSGASCNVDANKKQ